MELWAPDSRLVGIDDDETLELPTLHKLWGTPAARLLVVTPASEVALTESGALDLRRPEGEFDPERHFLAGLIDEAPAFVTQADLDGPVTGLRLALPGLDATERSLAITANALLQWHPTAAFCGRCGTPTEVAKGGNIRRCVPCARELFPRTDPAVITAILDADGRLLLAHNAAWAPNRMSLVAGFVNAGESLEACVRREAFEEVGLALDVLTYVASQPWPFPRSLMLGFVARAASGEIQVDGVEIDRARFFSAADYDAALADGTLGMPVSASIAGTIIRLWRAGGLPEPERDAGDVLSAGRP